MGFLAGKRLLITGVLSNRSIAYGIARSFDPDLTSGPTYLQDWLAGTPQYDTAWDFKANKTSLPPGLTTPVAAQLASPARIRRNSRCQIRSTSSIAARPARHAEPNSRY